MSREAALTAVLRRASGSPAAEALALRGSLVNRAWFGPAHRRVDDVDFLARDPDLTHEAAYALLMAALRREVGDGLEVDLSTPPPMQVLWPDTAAPGLRVRVPISGLEVQIDVGFGDPMDPPPTLRRWPGATLWTVGPETALAWKLHGLFEIGPRGRWRAKDLYDAWRLARHAPIAPEALDRALPLAFRSRGDALTVMDPLLELDWGHSRSSRRRWRLFRRDHPWPEEVPEDLQTILAGLAGALRPVRARLSPRGAWR